MLCRIDYINFERVGSNPILFNSTYYQSRNLYLKKWPMLPTLKLLGPRSRTQQFTL